jgi:CrcB protein
MSAPTVNKGRAAALVFAGGCIGTLMRASLSIALPSPPDAWPWATFGVNLAGAYLLGRVLRMVRRGELDTARQLFLATGVAGALTTFSALATEVIRLAVESDPSVAVLYAGSSIVLGLATAAAGVGREP